MHRLCALAIGDEKDESVNWLGVSLVNEREWKLLPAHYELYGGLSGIAFFLAYLGALARKEQYTVLAHRVVRALQKHLEQSSPPIELIGAFDGWCSLLYLFTHLGVLWDDSLLLHQAAQIVERINPLLEQDGPLDIISGAAGCILTLLALYDVMPSMRVLEVALRCGHHLVQKLGLDDATLTPEALRQQKVLTGYAHGAAGMALSLYKLATTSGHIHFVQAAETLLAFERALFSVADQNWPDLRDRSAAYRLRNQPQPVSDDALHFMTAWCHGASGIALSRMEILRTLSTSNPLLLKQEIISAIETTIHTGFGYNHSLCHGGFGNLEVLMTATQHCGMIQYTTELERLRGQLLALGEAHGWICGIPLGVETPGLMLGLAGIGYQLLRLALPDRCPCLLLLASPL